MRGCYKAFEFNTIKSCIAFKFANLGEKDNEYSSEWFGEYGPWFATSCKRHYFELSKL